MTKFDSRELFSLAGLSGLKIAIRLSVLLAVVLSCSSVCFADDPVTEAQRVFKLYTELEKAYDPTQADLFASNAVIKDTRVYQDGQNKTLTWNGDSYKQIVKAQLPVSKARGEQFVYSAPTFSHEGSSVRVKCTRASSLKKFSAPLELVIAPAAKGGWKIVEETLQSLP